MNKILYVAIGLILVWLPTSAQSIDEDPAIAQAMDRFVEYNKAHQTVRGWRVQIMVTTDRRQVEATRRVFEATFPEYQIHYRHDNPFYHLKSGAFLTQTSARPFLRLMQEKFASAFVVSDEIKLKEVLLYQ